VPTEFRDHRLLPPRGNPIVEIIVKDVKHALHSLPSRPARVDVRRFLYNVGQNGDGFNDVRMSKAVGCFLGFNRV
jgi:hypothetical protein